MPETRPDDESAADPAERRRRIRPVTAQDAAAAATGTRPRRRRAAGAGVRFHQAAIDREIVERHAARREALLEPAGGFACATAARRRSTAPIAPALVLDDEAGHAFVDDLRHRAAVEGDDRRAARHRLDHHQTERLGPIDRHQQRDARRSGTPTSRCRRSRRCIRHSASPSSAADLLLVIIAIRAIDLRGDLQRNAAMLGDRGSRDRRASPARCVRGTRNNDGLTGSGASSFSGRP